MALTLTPDPSPSMRDETPEPHPTPGAAALADELTRVLDHLHEQLGESNQISTEDVRRFVAGLDRSRRLRLAGALHLLTADLDGGAVVGG
jgi:hypothetical protein